MILTTRENVTAAGEIQMLITAEKETTATAVGAILIQTKQMMAAGEILRVVIVIVVGPIQI